MEHVVVNCVTDEERRQELVLSDHWELAVELESVECGHDVFSVRMAT